MFYFLLIALSTLLSLSGNVYAATYWVAKNGSDSRSCTQAQSQSTPKLTISSGLACLSAGDTLIVKAGTYIENLVNNIPAGTSNTNRTTVRAETPLGATIRSSGGEVVIGLTNTNYHHITIDGFILDGSNVGYAVVSLGDDDSTFAHHIRLQNSELKNSHVVQGLTLSGVVATDNTAHEIINVKIHDIGSNCYEPARCHGIYMGASGNLVDGCDIYNNQAHGMQSYSAGGDPSNNVVRNSKFHNNGGVGLGMYFGSGNQAYNNLVYSNGSGIVMVSINGTVYNNTIYGNSGPAIDCRVTDNGNKNQILRNNITFNNGGGTIADCSGITQSNNLSQNPGFVDAAGGNFHLQSHSPAINAGVTVSNVTTDAGGISRPQGASYDIGAYEFLLDSLPLPSPTNVRLVTR